MANDIRIDLTLTGEQNTARGLKNVGDAADKAGSEFVGMGKDAGFLKSKVVEAEAEIKKLTKALDETGDTSLLKSIRKEQGNLKLFQGLAKSLMPDPAEVVAAGAKTGVKFGQGLTESLMALRGPALAAAVVLAAEFAPAIGASVGAAVLGGVGMGGIIGGIVAASQDQRVQDEAKRVGNHIKSALIDASAPFVAPLIESLRILDNAGDRLAANFSKIGEKLGPVMPLLAKGLGGLFDEMMPGLIKSLDTVRPIMRAIANEMPKIGAALGTFFEDISKNGDGAIGAIVGIGQAIRGTINAVGKIIGALTAAYEWSIRFGNAVAPTFEAIFGWIPGAGDIIEEAGASLREQAASIEAAKDASGDYAGNLDKVIRAQEEVEKVTKTATERIEDQIAAFDKMFKRVMDPRELARNYQAAIDDLTESVRENGKSFDISTEKGRNNDKALQDYIETIKAIREQTIKTTDDVALADRVYNDQVNTLYRQMIALGMNATQAGILRDTLLSIPKTAEIEVRAPGLVEAIARAQTLNRLLGGNAAGARARGITIDGHKYVGDTSGYGGGRAGGGPMDPGKWYTVGENGVEVVSMHADGSGATVYNSKQTQAMMSGASGGAVATTVVLRANDAAVQALLDALHFEIEAVLAGEAALARGGVRD